MNVIRTFTVITIAIISLTILPGCGGGGGGSDQSTSTQTQQATTPTVSIAGKVVINGTDDYTGVVVVAEKTTGGVTARVQRMMDASDNESTAGRISAREALDTPGVYTTETDSTGNYKFADIPAGKYSISAYKESTLAAQPRIVEATTDGQSVTVDFELVATGSISGRAHFGTDTGNDGIIVYAQGTSYSAYTNDAGNYTISNVPVGTYTVTAMEPSGATYGKKSVTNTTVTAGNTTTLAALLLAYEEPILNEWIVIPAGDFIMGCATEDAQCMSYESPKHTVTLSEYKIQKYEITWFQYGQCVRAGICTPPGDDVHLYNGPKMNDAVVDVSWNQATTYCAWISGRLPTEAEWEKAARGPSPSESIYPWGNTAPSCSLLNYYNGTNFCVGTPTKVGSYPSGASYYGIMDMAGNAWEWVNDAYDSSYYTSSPIMDPQGPGFSPYDTRILRGGSWYNGTENPRVSARSYTYNYAISGNGNGILGVRCAQD